MSRNTVLAAALLLAATTRAHALKPGMHADVTEKSCKAAGLPDDMCTHAATADYDTDSNEWDDLRAHAQIDDGRTACESADATAARMWDLGHQLRIALSQAVASPGYDNAGAADELIGRALHTVQDNCAHHGMPNPQHAWFSLGDFCDGTKTSPDLSADAIACARVETDAMMQVIARAVQDAGATSVLSDYSCEPQPDTDHQNGQTPVCQRRYLPGPIDACGFLARAKDWDGIDRTWNNTVTKPALRAAFASGLIDGAAPTPMCGGNETMLSPATSQPMVDVAQQGVPSCLGASVFCLGKADGTGSAENPFGDDPTPAGGDGGCSATGTGSGGGGVGLALALLAIRRRRAR